MTAEFSAPGRCGIVGNPSDIYGGCVVSCSVPLRAVCRLETGEGEGLPEDPALWLAAASRFPTAPCRVSWSSAIPRSSGLAGSTALLATSVACLARVRGDTFDLDTAQGKSAFAELVRDVEFRDAGVVCGYQDAYMAVFGGLQVMDFSGKHPVEAGPPAAIRPLRAPLPFLLVTTGVERLSGSVHLPIRDRWLRGEGEVIRAMEEVALCGREGAEALVRGDYASLAERMKVNHELVKSLGGSGEAVDKLIQACEDGGALAAKLAGAGLGGTVIALTPDSIATRRHLETLGYNAFSAPEIVPGLTEKTSQ